MFKAKTAKAQPQLDSRIETSMYSSNYHDASLLHLQEMFYKPEFGNSE